VAVPSPDLGTLLRVGPFDAALRAAIRARGLSLDRLREHLRARGVTVTTATLSYWQSGRSRPERRDSVRPDRWVVRVTDYRPGDTGTLDTWSITL